MLTLEQMFEMQAELDAKIIKEKGLEGKDLIPNTVLALQVELGELANEWRGFKHWSKDQEPRIAVERTCSTCDGSGDQNWPASREQLLEGQSGEDYEECEDCKGTGKDDPQNKVLEEYVDCLHFILSIGNQNEYLEECRPGWEPKMRETITGTFLATIGQVNDFYEDQDSWEYCEIFHYFAGLGKQLGFDWEQIAEAYEKKNAVNHQRQANGY